MDGRNGSSTVCWSTPGNCDIYAQRVNGSGAVQWAINGIALSNATSNQADLRLISDGTGGAIAAWIDDRSGNWDIYAQRINENGTVRWTTDGVTVSAATGNQTFPHLASDAAGGAIITWDDSRDFGIQGSDIYAQRINTSGEVQWTVDGLPISTAAKSQTTPDLIPDDVGGAIIAWMDERNGNLFDCLSPGLLRNCDIYVQRINRNGVVQWAPNGIALTNAASTQNAHLVSDGSGGAIVAWMDYRNGNWDIYAQRINGSGLVQWTTNGTALSTAVNDQDFPQLVPDKSGGAIVGWVDARSTSDDIYAQRVNGSGAVQWAANGLPISTAVNTQGRLQLIPDSVGGAIIVWEDRRSVTEDHIYAQGVSASGRQ